MHGIRVSALSGGLCCNSEPQGEVTHTVDNDALVLRRVLCNSPQPRFHDVVPVKKLLFGAGLHPDLMLGVRREEVQGGYMQSELSCLGEFTETCA